MNASDSRGGAGEPRVADIMTSRPVTIHPEATVKELADLLRAHHISGVPVVDHERHVVGVVTEADLVAEDVDLRFPHYIQFLDSLIYLESTKKFEERLKKAVGAHVADIMSREVVTVHRDDEMRVAATLMSERRINLVPVIDSDHKLAGVVTRHDVVAGLGL